MTLYYIKNPLIMPLLCPHRNNETLYLPLTPPPEIEKADKINEELDKLPELPGDYISNPTPVDPDDPVDNVNNALPEPPNNPLLGDVDDEKGDEAPPVENNGGIIQKTPHKNKKPFQHHQQKKREKKQ